MKNPRRHEEFSTTTNKSVYNKIAKELYSDCPYCGWHRGCNRRYRRDRSWKEYRETQYKQKYM